MKCGLYARVSTSDKGQDVEMQLRELREYCQRREWAIALEFTDHCSGSKDVRPGLARLMAAARARQIDCVIVWKLDRFGRSLKHLVNALDDLKGLGVTFVSLRDGFDLSVPSGRLMFGVIATMAQFERELIAERVRAGMANAKAKGATLGRPTAVLDMSHVNERRANGESLRAIAADLRVSPALLVKRSKLAVAVG